MDSAVPNEAVDPMSGALSVVATDLALPGNAGFNLTVQRVYSSGIYPNYPGDLTLEEDSWAGIGWKLHFGRVIRPDATVGGETQIEMGDGSRQALYTTAISPGWITKSFWLYDKGAHVLKLPNGIVYTFGHQAYLGTQLGWVRYVTEIRDAFNNRVEFSYFAAPGPVDGVSQIRQYLGGGQVREINFTYDAALKGLASMTYGTKTWTYTQNAAGPPGFNVLRTVQPPVGVPTTYDYSGSAPGHELTVVHAPGGGTITYTYTDVVQVSGAVTTTGRGVATKTLGGSYVTPGAWTYTYGTGGNHDTTRIVCPCGTTTYRFNGIGNSGNFTGWLAGTIAEQTVEDASGVLEREEFTWIPSEAISTDPTIGSGGVWSDADVFKPLLQVHTTKRGTYTWTTTSEYHTGLGNFNDYGRPWRIFQDGELHRVIARTFQYGFGPYIVDRVSREEVTVGGQSFERNWVYTLSTGFLEKEALGHINLGSVTTYTPTGDGNVAWLNDPRGYVTSFAYSWGRVQQVTTPHLTKTHAINPDGTIASETVGGLTTTYEYDDAFRLLRMKPPGNTEWLTYEYDNLFAGYMIEQRLPTWTTTRFDGFGRVRNTLDQAGVKSWIERDACGRTTHASLPYTAGPGNVFTVTTYDGLSRPLTTTLGSAVTSYSYPGASVIVTTPENRQTNYEYKAFGSPADRVLSVVQDADNKFTSYGYDVFGNLTRVNGPNATGALGTLPERTWAYDARNRLVSETQPERGTTTYTYDNAGNLLTTLDANNVTTTLTYDGNSRLIKREMTGNVDNVELSYNALGQLVTMANPSLAFPNMSTAFEYETATGRLKKRTDLVTGQTFVSQYTYWPDDRLDQMTYPSGRVVKYTYANAGRLSLVQNNGTTFADLFTYEDAGHLASYRTGTVTHAFTYDARQRLYTTTAGGSAGLALTYYYDDANQIRQIGDTRPGMHQVFEYDKVGRLTAADGPWGNLRWAYDAAGNRLSETLGSITSYTYNTATQRLTSISGGQAESFTYDSAGRLVSDSRGTYTYNHRGLLATVTKPGGMSPFASYGYDPSGLRTRRWVDGDTTYTIRGAGGEVLSEYRAPCGGPVWSRDVIYAVGRPLGAVRTNASQPQVAVTAATANANENQGTINVGVRVTIPGGGTLSCPVTVGYEIAPGTASRGLDYTAVGGVLTFPSGTASGTVLNIAVPIVSDAINEAWKETFTVLLSTATGAEVIAPAGQTVSIVDDELAPVMWIEQPAEGALVKTPVYMSGWAIDENAPSGPGVDLIHIYATPSGGSAAFVGAGTYGDPRSYIADYFGPQFLNSGWIANVALAPGTYTLTVYARSTVTGTFNQSLTRNITVHPPDPHMNVEAPANGATLAQPFNIGGWAIDRGSSTGTGVNLVEVSAYPNPGSGAPAIPLGAAAYGGARPDVASAYGSPNYTNSGFNLQVRGLAPGVYKFVVQARSTVTNTFNQSREITVTVQANPHMNVDVPAPNSAMNQTFTIGGWAIDEAASSGTGVSTLHVYAYPNPGSGQAPIFLGVPTFGNRPDIAAYYGSQFLGSGFSLTATLSPGTYYLYVAAWSTVTNSFNQAQGVTFTVATSNPVMSVDQPAPSSTVSQPFGITGWAIDLGAPAGTGTGVDAVDVHVISNGGAGSWTYIGRATSGQRPDVAAYYGSQFLNSGWGITASGLAPGYYQMNVYMHSTVSGQWTWQILWVTVQ
jgi:YD repeat-containing protein